MHHHFLWNVISLKKEKSADKSGHFSAFQIDSLGQNIKNESCRDCHAETESFSLFALLSLFCTTFNNAKIGNLLACGSHPGANRLFSI